MTETSDSTSLVDGRISFASGGVLKPTKIFLYLLFPKICIDIDIDVLVLPNDSGYYVYRLGCATSQVASRPLLTLQT